MDRSKHIETSLLTEHLRSTPLAILDDIINTVNLLVNNAVDAVESGLLSADPETLGFDTKAAAENRPPGTTDEDGRPVYPEMRMEIEEGVHELETLLAANVDRNFDKFEIFALRNIFAVDGELAPWIRLRHYEKLNLQSAHSPTQQQQQQHSPETLRVLRRKLQETRKLHAALAAEKARNDALLAQLRSLMAPEQPVKSEQRSSSPAAAHESPVAADARPPAAPLSFLAAAPAAKTLGVLLPPAYMSSITAKDDASSISKPSPAPAPAAPPLHQQKQKPTPLSTNTSFTVSQLPTLQSLLAQLRPKLQAADKAAWSVSQGRFSRERSEYVEAQTMRILEHRAGGDGGGVRSGVPEDDGDEGGASSAAAGRRRVPMEEVEALERIVGGTLGNEQGRDEAGEQERMEE